jgi:hypothetical protein
MLRMSSKHYKISIDFGVASIKTDMQSRKMGTVVKMQITVKIIVVMGSAIPALGKKKMIKAAMTTPIL